MSDILIYQSWDDGEISVENGVIELTAGLDSAVYLSLFGGRDWWGNAIEDVTDRKLKSETETLLESIPITSENLLRIKGAVEVDLAWLKPAPVVSVTYPALNRVQIDVNNLSFIWGGK